MKQLKKLIMITLIPISLLCSCNGKSNANTSSDSTSSISSSTNKSLANSNSEAHFSCIIDGQPVSGGEISSYQGPEGYKSNEARIIEQDKELLFYLSDPASANTQGVHSLRFDLPNKTGISSFGHDETGWAIEVQIVVNQNHTARYDSDSFTVDITSLSATRLSGTFSGKFKLNGNVTDTDKKEIEVTDGKFDIPFSKK